MFSGIISVRLGGPLLPASARCANYILRVQVQSLRVTLARIVLKCTNKSCWLVLPSWQR